MLYRKPDNSPEMDGTIVISTVGSLRSHTISVLRAQLGFVKPIFGELM